MRSLLNILSGEEVEHIHRASLQILSETGVKINSSKVTKLLAQSGARVSGNNVRIPEELVQEAIDCAPVEVLLAARWQLEIGYALAGGEEELLSQSGENFIQKAGVKVKEVLSSHSASSLDQNKGELIRIILESARKETTC